MANSNVETTRGIYEAFAKGDVPTVLAAFDPNIVWEESEAPGHPWGGKNHGIDGVVKGVFMQIPANFDNFSVMPQDYVEAGDRVIAIGRVSGTSKATGKSFEGDFAHILTFSGGKVSRFQGIEDSAALMAALN